MPKFVACTFKPDDKRTYTYTWDGPELFPGDRVKVPDNRSDGWKAVTVVSVGDEAPPFQCKAIVGRVEDAPHTPVNIAEPDLGELERRDAAARDHIPGDDPVVQF